MGWWLLGVAESATASQTPEAGGAPAVTVASVDVVANVDGRAITRAEVEDVAADELVRRDDARRRALTAALDQRIDAVLLEAEAARRGVSVASLAGDRALLERLRSAAQIESQIESQ